MKKVWYYNSFTRPLEFWDFWSAVDELNSLVVAYNNIKNTDTYDTSDEYIVSNLIAASLYCSRSKRKPEIGQINKIIKNVKGNKRDYLRTAVKILKNELNSKDFEKCQTIATLC